VSGVTMDDDEKKSHVCVDCHVQSPPTDTNYTLISSRHGWRLTVTPESSGQRIPEWRCPKCWERHKRKHA
jgi:hypothetical protein